MPVGFRGTPQTGSASGGADVTLTFDVAPLQGDIVLVWGGHGNDGSSTGRGPTTAGYTERTVITGTDVDAGFWHKTMGVSPDSNVVCEGGADAGDGVVYQCVVLNGSTVHADIFDQIDASTGYLTTGVRDGPSIVTQTADARVMVFAFGSVNDTTRGTVSGYTMITGASVNETDDFACEAAYIDVASPGTEDPPAWSTWASSSGGAITIAVKFVGSQTFQQSLVVTVIAVAVVSAQTTFLRVLTATVVGVATLVASLLFKQTLAAVTVGVGTLSKQATFRETLAATTVALASFVRRIQKLVSATVIAVASFATEVSYIGGSVYNMTSRFLTTMHGRKR